MLLWVRVRHSCHSRPSCLQKELLPCCCASSILHAICGLVDETRHVRQRLSLPQGRKSTVPRNATLSYMCICPTMYQQRPPTSTSSSSTPTSYHVNALSLCSNIIIIMHAAGHGSALKQAQCCGQAHSCTPFGLHLSKEMHNKQSCKCNLIPHRVLHYPIDCMKLLDV